MRRFFDFFSFFLYQFEKLIKKLCHYVVESEKFLLTCAALDFIGEIVEQTSLIFGNFSFFYLFCVKKEEIKKEQKF